MDKFEQDLSTALDAEDRTFLDDLENGRGLFDQLGATLHGPMRYWSYMVWFFTFVFAVIAFYSGWQAFISEEIKLTVLWVAVCLGSAQAVGLLKMWMFDRMNMLSMLAELKRIELRVAQLSDKQN